MADTDRRPYYTQEAVGYNHPTKAQVVGLQTAAFHDMAGRHLWSGGSTVASAATISVPDNSNYFLVSGTTNITTINAKSTGSVIKIRFTGSLKLIDGANLVMPNSADLQVHSGDVVILHEETSGVWNCISVSRADQPLGGLLELDIVTHATNPTYQLTITADCISLHDSNNAVLNLYGINTTADITVSGAGGLDTGTEANSTWYYVYLICNGDKVTGVKSLLSTSATAPTMPAGYTFKKRIGSVYNDSGGNFLAFRQHDSQVAYLTSPLPLSGGSSTTFASVALSSPPTAVAANLYAGGSVAADVWYLSIDGTNVNNILHTFANTAHYFPFIQYLGATGALWYKRQSGTGTLTLGQSGYVDEIR